MLEGVFSLNNEIISLPQIIEKVKAIVIPKAKAKGLNCEVKIKNELPMTIVSDSKRLLQIIYNISFNAIKYTFKGDVIIKFSANSHKKSICIKVIDTGVGISSKDLTNINRLFGLLDKNFTQNKTGIGLGLLVVKSIVNAMKGDLIITSELNYGTKCKIVLPSLCTTHADIPPINELLNFHEQELYNPNASNTELLSSTRALVIDDEPFIQIALGGLLKKLGCTVDKASNGQLGVDMIINKINQGEPYSIVFMDANMPVMSGYEAAKIIKSNPSIKCPVVCVSAQDSIRHKNLCKEVGMNDILPKPCTIDWLKNILIKYKLL